MNLKIQAAASNGQSAVLIGEFTRGGICLVRHAGKPMSERTYDALCDRAAGKLGWVRDKKALGGWRKII